MIQLLFEESAQVAGPLGMMRTDPAGGFLPGVLQVGIDDSSLELQARLDEEYAQLLEDRRTDDTNAMEGQ